VLADPRRYGAATPDNALLALIDSAREHELVGSLRELAAAKRDAEIGSALAAASTPESYAKLWRALCAAVEKPPAEDDLVPRVFAIPWVIVCGGTAAGTVSCVLHDVDAVARVLQEHGVFGGSRNLGLSNALCGVTALETLTPSEALRAHSDARLRDVAPEPIEVLRGVQQVHVRFLLGAAIVPAHAPAISETGANVAAWGTPALRAMATQLATPNVQVLPMPRAPGGLYSAAYAGRRAGIEAGFNLFMSNSVRQFRMATGDPAATISSHANGEIRIVLWSNLDDTMVEGFSWPLHPADDLDEIERTITSLIEECRLPEPTIMSAVLPDRTSTGAVLFHTG
jgi:hypothetical protein